jgi:flavin reductase (DIM6/NTAB) family NADH-FMN oxidoreductase RutF
MSQTAKQTIDATLSRVPSGLFVICAAHEDRRAARLTSWVQQVCYEPPMISVALGKGQPVMPLISESRQFGLCQLGADDRVMMRKFATPSEADEDPFLGFDLVQETALDVPLLKNTLAQIECTLVCHVDVEGDHDLFIGQVQNTVCHKGEPHVHIRAYE